MGPDYDYDAAYARSYARQRGTFHPGFGWASTSKMASEPPLNADEKEEKARLAPFTQKLLFALPVEMLVEIFKYLDLPDLFQLAKTSPPLNRLLRTVSAESIWRASRLRSGLLLPPDMTEIQLAVFLEGSQCSLCGNAHAPKDLWSQARLCSSCWNSKTSACSHWSSVLGGVAQHPALHRCVLLPNYGGRKIWQLGRAMKVDVLSVNAELLRLDPSAAVGQPSAVALSNPPPISTSPATSNKDAVDTFIAAREAHMLCKEDTWKHNKEVRHLIQLDRDKERKKLVRLYERLRVDSVPSHVKALWETLKWSASEVDATEGLFNDRSPVISDYFPPESAFSPTNFPHTWNRFKAACFAAGKGQAHELSKSATTRRKLIESWYRESKQELGALSASLPPWTVVKELPDVEELFELPHYVLRDPDHQLLFTSQVSTLIAELAATNRAFAIRHILASLDERPETDFPTNPAAYPPDKYNQSFFLHVAHLFEVEGRSFLTYSEAVKLKWEPQGPRSRPEWRRAIAHVMRSAELPDEHQVSLTVLDELGTVFEWKNGPNMYRGKTFDWRKMIDLLLQHGPEGMHLHDLRDVTIIRVRDEDVDATAPRRSGRFRGSRSLSSYT